MRHNNHNRKFGRKTKVRTALLKSLIVALATKEKIKTTEAKAKELRPIIEKLVTKGKTDTVASRRLIISRVGSLTVANRLIKLGTKYEKRAGGYTRITKLSPRLSDGSPMAVIEFV